MSECLRDVLFSILKSKICPGKSFQIIRFDLFSFLSDFSSSLNISYWRKSFSSYVTSSFT